MTSINNQRAVAALLDLYKQAILGLMKVMEDIPDAALTIIIDTQTTDENCVSIQAILSHVISSGYGYATSIHNLKGPNWKRPDKTWHTTIKEYSEGLTDMYTYTENIFREINDNALEQFDNSLKIKAGWGQVYDIEQMAEHAIVHILRHKRQIEHIKRGKLI